MPFLGELSYLIGIFLKVAIAIQCCLSKIFVIFTYIYKLLGPQFLDIKHAHVLVGGILNFLKFEYPIS